MWSDQQKLDVLLRFPWTIYAEETPEGDRLLRVRELPSVIGSGSNEDELERDFWDSLETSLRSYLHFDDEIPLPLGVTLPWKQPASAPAAPSPRRAFRVIDNEPRPIDQPETAAVERWQEKQLDQVVAV